MNFIIIMYFVESYFSNADLLKCILLRFIYYFKLPVSDDLVSVYCNLCILSVTIALKKHNMIMVSKKIKCRINRYETGHTPGVDVLPLYNYNFASKSNFLSICLKRLACQWTRVSLAVHRIKMYC